MKTLDTLGFDRVNGAAPDCFQSKTLTAAELGQVSGGGETFGENSVNKPNFSFIREGSNWRPEKGGGFVGTIGNDQRVRLNGESAIVARDDWEGGREFRHDGNAWKYFGEVP